MDYAQTVDLIISKLRLTSEIKQAHVCLEEFMNTSFSHDKSNNLEAYCSKLPADLPQIFKETFLTDTATIENQTAYKQRIDTLINKLYTCRIVQLTLAFKPDQAAITLFSDWVKKNIGHDAVIDLEFNPAIVGGAQLIYDGKYKDYSVRKQLASAYQLHRDDIMNLLT